MNARARALSPRLPLHTLARLYTVGRIDRAGAWLCGHGPRGARAAEWMWRACRLW